LTTATKLTGSALLEKVAELGDIPKTEVLSACGYIREDGKYCFTEYYSNLLDAKGITLDETIEEDEYWYQVSVPVYVTVNHYGKKGMTRDEVLKAITFDECCEADVDYIGEMIEDSIKRDDDVSVFDNMGETLCI
jgi:hypothetical protein